MESNDKSKEINIKYFFNNIIKIEDFNFDNILLDEKSRGSALIYDMSDKLLTGRKTLRISFDGLVRVYDGTRYLVLFGGEKKMISFTTGWNIL